MRRRQIGRTHAHIVAVAAAAVVAVAPIAVPPAIAAASTFTVNSTLDSTDAAPGNGLCADATGSCTLRAAVMEANANVGSDTIVVPAGTYTLTLSGYDDDAHAGDLDVTDALTIVGAGSGSTIVRAGVSTATAIDKIFSFNPQGMGLGFPVTISGLTLLNGRNEAPEEYNKPGGCLDFDAGLSGSASNVFAMNDVVVRDCAAPLGDGGGIALYVSSGGGVSITNSTIASNVAGGAGVAGWGGGVFIGTTYGGGIPVDVTLRNVTISGNSAPNSLSDGGGIWAGGESTPDKRYTLDSVVLSNNNAGRDGGGIAFGPDALVATMVHSSITGNLASLGVGGGIRFMTGALTVTDSRFSGNVNRPGAGSGLSLSGPGTVSANGNWWGCSQGPSAAPCDLARQDGGAGVLDASSWYAIRATASPAALSTNGTSTVTAVVTRSSDVTHATVPNTILETAPVAWYADSVKIGDGTIAAGTVAHPYVAASAGVHTMAAVVDGDGKATGPNVATFAVSAAATSTDITSDLPDPSSAGASITVTYSVSGAGGNLPTAPTGNVTVTDGTSSCTGTVAAGSCSLVPAPGVTTLTATYSGDANFGGSTSSGATHLVGKADTTTTIASHSPSPSVVGEPVTFGFAVTSGYGTPAGNVTISDGTQSCTATVAAGSCTIAFTTPGAHTVTASYPGDATYDASTSAAVGQTVNQASTTTTVLSALPDPSHVGENVTVAYAVSVVAPGGGTPTGNVTVSDGIASCGGTVAAGWCDLGLTGAGPHSLVATYSGDTAFGGSTSPAAIHGVALTPTTTTFTVTPSTSVSGETVTVDFTVTPSILGLGDPTGNVSVSDGTTTCVVSVAAGSCDLTLSTAGSHVITATYSGDEAFATSADSAAHTVAAASTTTSLLSHTPAPSAPGASVAVAFRVDVVSPGAGVPTGTVTVSDGVNSCTAAVADGSCTLWPTTPGTRTLTASYSGDADFASSTSAGTGHQVLGYPTTASVVSASVTSPVVGQPVSIGFSVVPHPLFNAQAGPVPAAASPLTGTVTVSDGTVSCTAPVADGACSLMFAHAGSASLVATYSGDAFWASSSSEPFALAVGAASTTTSIASHDPNPSTEGSGLVVHFAVGVSAPGAGTPDGNVTVSNGTVSCTALVAAGQCSIALPVGTHTLTATYAGSADFGVSTSAPVVHVVTPAATASPSSSATATPSVSPTPSSSPSASATVSASASASATASPSESALASATPSATATASASSSASATAAAPTASPRVTPPPTVSRAAGAPPSGSSPLGVIIAALATLVLALAASLAIHLRRRSARSR